MVRACPTPHLERDPWVRRSRSWIRRAQSFGRAPGPLSMTRNVRERARMNLKRGKFGAHVAHRAPPRTPPRTLAARRSLARACNSSLSRAAAFPPAVVRVGRLRPDRPRASRPWPRGARTLLSRSYAQARALFLEWGTLDITAVPTACGRVYRRSSSPGAWVSGGAYTVSRAWDEWARTVERARRKRVSPAACAEFVVAFEHGRIGAAPAWPCKTGLRVDPPYRARPQLLRTWVCERTRAADGLAGWMAVKMKRALHPYPLRNLRASITDRCCVVEARTRISAAADVDVDVVLRGGLPRHSSTSCRGLPRARAHGSCNR